MTLPTATLTGPEVDDLRALLEALRAENEADLRRARTTLEELSAAGLLADPSMREESTNAEYLVQDATGILEMIDRAMERLAAGSFGTCTSCGSPIPFRRLRARPYSPTCVACSS